MSFKFALEASHRSQISLFVFTFWETYNNNFVLEQISNATSCENVHQTADMSEKQNEFIVDQTFNNSDQEYDTIRNGAVEALEREEFHYLFFIYLYFLLHP